MHTEHLQNVTVGRVLGGWLVAIAVTSLIVFVFLASGLGDDTPGISTSLASLIAVVAGFWAGGFFVGFRALRAPILHAAGWVSLRSWRGWRSTCWHSCSGTRPTGPGWVLPAPATALVLAQMTAAIVGALVMGYNVALRGKPGLHEDIAQP